MSVIKNLFENEAIDKLKNITSNSKTCLFCTNLFIIPIKSRPMTLLEVDDLGNLWFICSTTVNSNFAIDEDDRVQLFFIANAENHYLNLFGTAKIITTETVAEASEEALWEPALKALNSAQKQDAQSFLIRVVPSNVHYWNAKEGKLIALLKMATGDKPNLEEEGELKIN